MKIKSFILIIMALAALALPTNIHASEGSEDGTVNVKEIIFHHLGDGYGWEVPFSHVYRIPLPVIVRAEDGKWISFSSHKLQEYVRITNEKTGKEELVAEPRIVNIEKDGKTYQFILAHVSKHRNKVVQIFPLSPEEEARIKEEAKNNPEIQGDIDKAQAIIGGYAGFNQSLAGGYSVQSRR